MEFSAELLLTIGTLSLFGLFASTLAKRTFLPRVTILILFGAMIGQEGLDLIPVSMQNHFNLIADMTLLMVGFLLGGKLHKDLLTNSLKQVMWVSICASVGTAFIVTLGLYALGLNLTVAIILGCIAAATDPAAILDVITELKSHTPTSKQLLSIVALDDIWALIIFALGMALLQSINGGIHEHSFVYEASYEIFGSILLGVIIGIPAAYLTGRVKDGQPIFTEAIGIVFLCGGLSMLFDLSYLIAAMVMGSVISNLAKHHEYPFHAIENIEAPFLVVFFILAGASLDWQALSQIGLLGAAFIGLRIIGKFLGAALGGYLSDSPKANKIWMGPALLPQAGIAIGLALVASNEYPDYSQTLLTIAISSTVLFEILGPIVTQKSIVNLDKSNN